MIALLLLLLVLGAALAFALSNIVRVGGYAPPPPVAAWPREPEETIPEGYATPERLRVWRDYRDGRISALSFLLRIDALFDAAVSAVEDWDALDWTTAPLEPLPSIAGRWRWDDDRLVALDEIERLEFRVASAYANPGTVSACERCAGPTAIASPSGLCAKCLRSAVDVFGRPLILDEGMAVTYFENDALWTRRTIEPDERRT